MSGPARETTEVARQLLNDVGPLVTYCRIFATGPPCPTPCDDCRRTSRDVHKIARSSDD